jgi:hypothetical protein
LLWPSLQSHCYPWAQALLLAAHSLVTTDAGACLLTIRRSKAESQTWKALHLLQRVTEPLQVLPQHASDLDMSCRGSGPQIQQCFDKHSRGVHRCICRKANSNKHALDSACQALADRLLSDALLPIAAAQGVTVARSASETANAVLHWHTDRPLDESHTVEDALLAVLRFIAGAACATASNPSTKPGC